MITPDAIARATLDTLPINVAVLDEEGTILYTNRAWKEFSGIGTDMTGTNYLSVADTDDEYASQAVAGIEAVIENRREEFTLEYPCHTPDQPQWFLMRVAPLSEEETGSVVVAHVDITERKLAEIRAERRATELREQRANLEHLLDRLDGLVGNVLGGVMSAESRSSIRRTVCDRIAEVDPYTLAWVAEREYGAESLSPVASSAPLDTDATLPLEADDPTARAARTGELQVLQHAAGAELAPIHATLSGSTPPSVAAIPLTDGETLHGVVTVYADDPDAFDERELAVLRTVGRATSTAISAIESRRMLTTDEVTELQLRIEDPSPFFVALSSELGCRLEYSGSVTEGSATLSFFLVEGADPSEVVAFAAERSDVRGATHLAESDDAHLFEFAVDDPPIVGLLADHGADTRAIVAEAGAATVTAEVPTRADVRPVVEAVRERYSGVELVACHDRERPPKTAEEFAATVDGRLTDRQRTALLKGYVSGFFQWPREISGEELAESMDISPSTYHQHLRAAERKLLEEYFDTRSV
ncbi:MAG: bacterio-opsin activator domain-containing protein [Haloarculaceae archaeon]